MTDTSDRRRAARFPLNVPMDIRQPGAPDDAPVERQTTATIRDISATGVYFFTDEDMQADEKIEFFVELQGESAMGRDVVLHCLGSVLRTQADEEQPGRFGVAACIEHYQILPPDKAKAAIASQEKNSASTERTK